MKPRGHDNNEVGNILLSLLCGLALLGSTRFVYAFAVVQLPDTQLMTGTDPMMRLALARLLLFTFIVVVIALVIALPLHRLRDRPGLLFAMPGASCAAMLFVLLEQWQRFDPFPAWFTVARAVALFIALPVTLFLWRRTLR